MNTWSVVFQKSAEKDFGEICWQIQDISLLSEAVQAIDHALRNNPLEFGEARSGLIRLAFVYPLSIVFEVIPDDRKVIVEMLRLY